MIINRKSYHFLALLMLGWIFILTIAVVLWGANKGLGFGDEGIYLLSPRYPGEIQQNVSAIFTFTGHLFSLVSYNPTLFRVLGVVAVILSAMVFWVGFHKLLVKLLPEAESIRFLPYYSLLFVMIGAVLHYQWSYLTPSYYTLTAVVVNVFSGFMAFALARLESTQPSPSFFAFFAAGITFGVTLFFKFPTAIPLLLCAIALIGLWGKTVHLARVKAIVCLLVGFLVWLFIYFSLEQSPARTVEMFKEGWLLYQTLGYHKPADKLLAYPKDVFVLGYTAVYEYWPCYLMIVFAAAFRFFNRRRLDQSSVDRFQRLLIWSVVVIALLISINAGVHVNVPDRFSTAPVDNRTRPYLAFQLGWIILLGALYLFCFGLEKVKIFSLNRVLLFLIFLLVLPVTGSFGTSNPIFNVIQFYAVPWFGVIFLLLTLLVLHIRSSLELLVLILLGVSAYTASQVVQGSAFQPAQLKPRSLFEQSVPTQVGNPAYILKLDAETNGVINQLSSAAKANGFEPGDDIIGFNEIAGLIYALGGRSPGHPVFPCCVSERSNAYSKMALTFAEPERLKKSFVLLSLEPNLDISSTLGSVGINFPADYQLVARVNGLGRSFMLYKPNRI